MTSEPTDQHATKKRRRGRGFLITVASLVGVALVVGIVASVTPWPSAMLIRAVFERGGAATVAEMTPYVPDAGLHIERGITYDSTAGDSTLDIFTPAADGETLPAVVWIHGGAWISGSSADVDPYLQILAAEGYTTIGLNYGLGPESTYPTAVVQLNDALAYINANADELRVDPSRIVLAGDSAGGQLASQMATLTTNDDYAELMDITPALAASQLSGVILNCGVYDLRSMAELEGLFAWGLKVSLWAYTGHKDWSQRSSGAMMSTIEFVNEDFPATYISGGNGDPLTWLQSIPMAQRLDELGVDVTDVFWPAPHEPQLPHEYQFHLDLPEAREALAKTIAWLEATVPAD